MILSSIKNKLQQNVQQRPKYSKMYKCKQVTNFDIGFEELTAFPGGSAKISKYPAATQQLT